MARRAGNRRRTWLRLGLLVVTAIALLTLDARGSGGVLDTARGSAQEVLGPVRTFGDWVTGPIRDAWRGLVSFDDLETENAQLRGELASVRASVLRVGELERDRQELLALLDARDVVQAIPRVTARVIDAPVSNFERHDLDAGRRDGIREGMPVESGDGLIGRVVEVTPSWASVELLTDPNFDVGVRIVRSGDDGLASGRGPGRDLKVSYIELETVVIPGGDGGDERLRGQHVSRRAARGHRHRCRARRGARSATGHCSPCCRSRAAPVGAGAAL